ncbi:LuxR C-terminal-related transcriptional regulator [Pontibacterium granulatum]|uniref:helix-turn-helix transcriptional regulator n=1 Tax=Pontibacterium granulatum TaxID=2036029 RepID=UPI00249B258C|nr:LuxR family transcriptional regulator [Pontibacterium granulatum]MDI3325475.1 LuxR C-terminal-related transcriptional regulator [Pontibacterium granulatum]
MNDAVSVLPSCKAPVVFSSNLLVSECSWDKIFSELQGLLKQLGFVYFTYSSVPRDLGSKESLFSLTKRRYGTDTQGTLPEHIVTRYYREMATLDPLWKALPLTSQPVMADSRESTSSPMVDGFWQQYGISSRVYVPVGKHEDKPWFNYFGLYHEKSQAEFNQLYRDLSGTLLPLLERCHKLLLLDGTRDTNPYLKHSVFSATCTNILRMTAEGMSVKMIADNLGLTEEGVTYHITRAKKVLNARNKTQLIARLYQSGIL